MSTFEVIVCTALCKALCLLLCRKIEIPPYAKPANPEIMVLKIPILLVLPSKKIGKIKFIYSLIYGEQFCCTC